MPRVSCGSSASTGTIGPPPGFSCSILTATCCPVTQPWKMAMSPAMPFAFTRRPRPSLATCLPCRAPRWTHRTAHSRGRSPARVPATESTPQPDSSRLLLTRLKKPCSSISLRRSSTRRNLTASNRSCCCTLQGPTPASSAKRVSNYFAAFSWCRLFKASGISPAWICPAAWRCAHGATRTCPPPGASSPTPIAIIPTA